MLHTRRDIDVPLLMAEIGHRLSDPKRLQILNVCIRDRLDEAHERTQRRASFVRNISELAQGGRVALVWSGMDCDCVRYSGEVEIVEATVMAVQQAIDNRMEWVDGPTSFQLMTPADAATEQYTSRDLALEAYENGHPHHING